MAKARVNVWISAKNKKRLEAYAGQPGTSQTSIVDAALDAWFDPNRNALDDGLILKRLGQIDERHNDFDANLRVTTETLGHFILYWLTMTEPLRAGERDDAHRLGRARFDRFLDQISQKLSGDESFSMNVLHRLFENDHTHTNA